MRVVICGGRDYRLNKEDREWLAYLHSIYDFTEVLCGEARGADTGGKVWAEFTGIPVRSFPALWDVHGKRAGFIRNAEMAAESDMVVAFPGGNGTADMVSRAERKGIPVVTQRRF